MQHAQQAHRPSSPATDAAQHACNLCSLSYRNTQLFIPAVWPRSFEVEFVGTGSRRGVVAAVLLLL